MFQEEERGQCDCSRMRGKEAEDEFRNLGKGQIMQNPIDHGNDSEYSKYKGKTLVLNRQVT